MNLHQSRLESLYYKSETFEKILNRIKISDIIAILIYDNEITLLIVIYFYE